MPETQYFTGIDVVSNNTTILSADVIDKDARVRISDIADFVGYLSYLDGVTYNVNSTSPVLEQGRFWTKWDNHKGLNPIDNSGNQVKVDWTQDWEIGVAFLFRTEVIWSGSAVFGIANSSAFWCDAPVIALCFQSWQSQPLHHFILRKSDSTKNNANVMNCDVGFEEGTLADTWYFLKASYNSETKTFTMSATKDFETWVTNTATYTDRTLGTSTYDYGAFCSENVSVATEYDTPAQNVILDLANCYIKQNGIMVWGHFDGAFAGENHYQNPAMPWRPLNDGYSNFWFELTDDTLSPWLNFSNKNVNATIDWGDGSGEVSLNTLTPTHTYSKAGKYVVKVKGVTGIAQQIFVPVNSTYYRALQYAELNSDITTLKNHAFNNCTNLKRIVGNVRTTGTDIFRNSSLEKFEITGFTTILARTFYMDCNLNTADITGITSIENDAFYTARCLKSITIPATVTFIGNNAFAYCASLTDVHVQATTPPTLGYSVFNNMPYSWVCYVPVGTGETYKAAAGWSAYANHITEEGSQLTRSQLRNIELENSKKSDDGDLK